MDDHLPPPPPATTSHTHPPSPNAAHPSPPPHPFPPSASAPPAAAKTPPSSSSSPLLLPNPKRDPSAASAPTKIPSRPRKTRKLAEAGDGDGGAIVVAAAPVSTAHNHARALYGAPPRPLSAHSEVAAAVRHLRAADPHLAGVIDAHGPPVFQSLHPPFHALARSILQQQLAPKAAASIYSRFLALCGGEGGVVPDVVLGLPAHQLRQIGVSARKAGYLHDLSGKYRSGILSDALVAAMDDKSLFTMLNMVKGIGAWSVQMFMIFSLHRPDVLPVGDVGVRKGVQLLYGLDAIPRPSQMEQLCERWRPYRSVGCWYMWRLVEAKGVPAALPSGGAVAAAADGGGRSSPVVGVPPPMPPACGGPSLVVGVKLSLPPTMPLPPACGGTSLVGEVKPPLQPTCCGTSLLVEVKPLLLPPMPPPVPPPPPLLPAMPPPHLRRQIHQQHRIQHQHLQQHQHLHPPQHPPTHQHQLQIRAQFIDSMQSISNRG